MDKETIKQIAAELAAQLPFAERTGPILVLYLIITAVVAGLAAWFGAFLKIKGQNFATKQDFDELLKQLRANTELVETIKSEVGQRDWEHREWINLRRFKLETLFEKMYECETELDRRQLAVSKGLPLTEERDYVNQFVHPLQTISTLYLPELTMETAEFYTQCLRGHFAVVALDQQLRDAGDDSAARDRAYDDFNKSWQPDKRLDARFELEGAARTFLERLMGVRTGSGLTS
jgi:hypothetical protein